MEEQISVVSSVKREDWSKFVSENPYGNVFQTPEMEEVYSKTKNLEPICLFAVDESDNILSSILAYVSTEKGGVFKHVSRRAVVSGGPLFKDSADGRISFPKLMQSYDEIASKKTIFTDIRMIQSIPEFTELQGLGYKHEEHLNFILNLSRPEEVTWEGIHKSKKRGIKKAQNSGVTIHEAKNQDDIKVAYNLLKDTYGRAKIPVVDSTLFESAFEILGPLDRFRVFLLTHSGRQVATRIILTYRDTVSDWYNGCTEESFDLCANDLSEWNAIKWSIDNRYKFFDFCGAGKPNEPYGPREFKRGFGGQLVNFGRYRKVYHPSRLKIAKVGYDVYRKAFIR